MTTPTESEKKEWFIVWHRRHAAESRRLVENPHHLRVG
jgi:hypothetical protein